MFWRKKGIVFVTFSTGPKYFYNMFLDIGCLTKGTTTTTNIEVIEATYIRCVWEFGREGRGKEK